MNLGEWLDDHIYRDPNSGCWIWLLGCANGYGAFNHQYAHRFVFELYGGDVSQHVLHKCDVRSCVNPRHLYAGTDKDNGRDRVARGQHRCNLQKAWGRERGLTAEEREAIFLAEGAQLDIAAQYGCSQMTVSRIKRGL